jgi:alpha-D-xyloside xylohydrolase
MSLTRLVPCRVRASVKRAVLAGLALGAVGATSARAASLGTVTGWTEQGRSIIVATADGQRVRITPYGPDILRVQAVAEGQLFWGDDRYEMVLSHDWPGSLRVDDAADELVAAPATGNGLGARVHKAPLRIDVVEGDRTLVADEPARGIDTGERPLELAVDGRVVRRLAFAPTGAWTEWQTTTQQLDLASGQHVVTLTAVGPSGPNVDYLEVARSQSRRYEAEAAALAGPSVASDNAGFSGRGYADFGKQRGQAITWTVDARETGTYELTWRYANASPIAARFTKTAGEHFLGLGHDIFGRVPRLDLAGQRVTRNRAFESTLSVPFFMSSHGYGIFANNTYTNEFAFLDADYGMSLAGGQVDYFVIAGPSLATILDRYTQLTGRPSLPPASLLGLGLSDKLEQELPSSEAWWKDKVERMHAEGYPFNMIVHDNSWRNGKSAPWEWDLRRYPDPAEFNAWCREHGIVNMLDFNRDDAALSDGWRPTYAVPGTRDFPDFTSPEVRDWFWGLLWEKSLDPTRGYPGDMLWLDEFDELVAATAPLADGRRWEEISNYYLFLLAKTVGEGWERGFGDARRPFFMARGMAAGAQRWASLWSGDIDTTNAEMALQVRGMLASGLSGFPYWGHDAGGFMAPPGNDLFRRWAVAFGAFTPIWKPHGPGLRFPWQYDAASQAAMRGFGELRSRLLPYNYTYAHVAHDDGLPMARALPLEYADRAEAWSFDLEYLWGHELLAVPDLGQAARFWLPPGDWYDYFTSERLAGDRVVTQQSFSRGIGLYVRAGAIIPLAPVALTPADWDKTSLTLQVYAGADGRFELVDDDGISLRFRRGQQARTLIDYADADRRVQISGARGTYEGAPTARSYAIELHGLERPLDFTAQGEVLPRLASLDEARGSNHGTFWDAETKTAYVFAGTHPVDADVVIEALRAK